MRRPVTNPDQERTPGAGRTPLVGLLCQPACRRLWTARTVSQCGDAFTTVAPALPVYSLAGSGLGVSGVVVAEIVPVLVLAPLAGTLVDRWPRVRVMVVAPGDYGLLLGATGVGAAAGPLLLARLTDRRRSGCGPTRYPPV